MDIVDQTLLHKRALLEFDSSLGRTLRSLRNERELEQDDVAKVIGHSQSLVSKIENGERSLHYAEIVLYAEALDMTIDELSALLNDALKGTETTT